MKKAIIFFLVVAMTAALCACGGQNGSAAAGKGGLRVGFARENVMPEGNVLLAGGGDPNRISEGYLDFITITCVAITDSTGQTALLYAQDLQNASTHYSDPARSSISSATGVPVENIYMAATHTHSAPSVGDTTTPGNVTFNQAYNNAIIKVAQKALEDCAPAEISVGTTVADGLAFVRHYILADGSYAGSNFGDWSRGAITAHVYEADEEVQLVKFARKDKKDVLLVSFGVHCTFNGDISKKFISADLPSPTRDFVESNADCLVAYFTGAAGDQVPQSLWSETDHGLDYKEYGKRLGQHIVDALPAMTPCDSADIKFGREVYTGDTQVFDATRVADAQIVYDAFLEGGREAVKPLLKEYDFVSQYEASAIISGSSRADTEDVNMSVMTLGNLSFVFAPYEMFGQNGKQIKDQTPFDMTFIITCCNGAEGYIPVERAYEYRCYEAYVSPFAPGNGEKMAQFYLDMLTKLK